MQLVGLGTAAKAYLDEFAAELANQGIDVPTAQYVAAGEVPWDAESLVISLGGIAQGIPGQGIATSFRSASEAISVATFAIELIRTVSTSGYGGGVLGLPDEYAMDNEGVSALNDAGAMVQSAILLKSKGIPVALGVDYAIGQCLPIGPLGGLAAVRLEIAVSIDGQPYPASSYPGEVYV